MLDSALVPALGARLLHQIAHLLFLVVLLMGWIGADSISRERREGTLGLLFLTSLSSGQIVYGKLLSCGLTAFLALLGCLPALMVSVLLGGVTGGEAAMTGIGLVNTLFVALAAGLWASARFRQRHHVFPITLTVLLALVLGPQVLGGALFGLSAPPIISLFSLSGWMTAARVPAPNYLPFLCWLVPAHALGWLFLRSAALALAANWQDQPHPQVRPPEPEDQGWEMVDERWKMEAGYDLPSPVSPLPEEGPEPLHAPRSTLHAPPLTQHATRNTQHQPLLPPADPPAPRPWDADPMRWRVQKIGSPEAAIVVALALDFIAHYATLGLLLHDKGLGDSSGLLCALGTAAIFSASAVLAWVGARFFQQARRQQDLELLLTTPLGARNILSGQWHVLRRALAWPLVIVLAVAVPSAISIISHLSNGNPAGARYFLPPFLIPVNLAVEVIALCWVGMWFGLRARNIVTSVAGAVSVVQLLPLVPALALISAWMALRPSIPPLVPALLFLLVKNLACIAWARFRILGFFRAPNFA